MYNFGLKNTIKRLLHPLYRKGKNIAWLFRVFSYLGKLKNLFTNYRDRKNYELQFNAQTMSIEARLNEFYNVPFGTIYIETVSVEEDAVYIFWLSENQNPTFISWLSESAPVTYIRWLSEYLTASAQYEFVIWFPQGFTIDAAVLTSLVNKYKMAGKRFVIQYY